MLPIFPAGADRSKTEIVFLADDFRQIATHLLQLDPVEQLAFAFAEACQNRDELRLLVKEFWLSEPAWYDVQSSSALKTKKDLMRQVLGKVAATRASLIEIHSHPTSEYDVTFSIRDEASESVTFPYVADRIPDVFHATMVMGRYSIDAHMWDRQSELVVPVQAVRVVGYPPGYMVTTSNNCFGIGTEIGSTNIIERSPTGPSGTRLLATTWYDARMISDLQIGIVGSAAATIETLADKLREVGFCHFLKLSVSPDADFSYAYESFKQLDILVSIIDDMTILSHLNRLSLQYYIPYVALVGRVVNNPPSALWGGIFIVLPNLPCLACQGVIPATQAPPSVEECPARPDGLSAVITRGVPEILNLARPSSAPQSLCLLSPDTQFTTVRAERRDDCCYCANPR